MGEQLVISISREFGSGGHEIAAKLAERLDKSRSKRLRLWKRSCRNECRCG